MAKVVRVERHADSAFARIDCEPMARVGQARHVLVLTPLDQVGETADAAAPSAEAGGEAADKAADKAPPAAQENSR